MSAHAHSRGGYRGAGRARTRGFTLIELVVAAAIALFVTMAALSLLFQAAHVADTSISQVRMNDEARLVFRLLLDGGAEDRDGSNAIDAPGEAFPGIHGTAATTALGAPDCLTALQPRLRGPQSLALPAPGNRVLLLDAGGNPVLGSSALGGPIDVQCFGVGDPLAEPACPGAAATALVNGQVSLLDARAALPPLGSPVGVANPAGDTLLSVRFAVIDPSRLVLAGVAEREFLQREHTEEYRFLAACQRF